MTNEEKAKIREELSNKYYGKVVFSKTKYEYYSSELENNSRSTLLDFYQLFSQRKLYAYRKLTEKYDFWGGYEVSVISGNSSFFTMGCRVMSRYGEIIIIDTYANRYIYVWVG